MDGTEPKNYEINGEARNCIAGVTEKLGKKVQIYIRIALHHLHHCFKAFNLTEP